MAAAPALPEVTPALDADLTAPAAPTALAAGQRETKR
jgi:hypothetical protein